MIITYDNYMPYIRTKLLVDDGKNYTDIPVNNYTTNILNLPIGVAEKMSVHLLRNIADVNRDYLCIAQYNLTYESDRSLMKKYSFVEYLGKSSLDEYLMNMKRSKYCLSPHGMWPDCYRHWEAMYMGCIPITLKHEKLEKFYDMPILFLDSWEELTEEMLVDKYEEVSGRSRHKLELEYWIQLAKNIKGV